MTTIIVCLIIAVLLPYISKVPLAFAMQKAGGYNNNYPRTQMSQLSGFGARAAAAHQNSFESLAVFSTAAVTALATNHVSATIQDLAMAYIAFRVVYHCMYLMNLSTLRSLIWFCSTACCVAILWLCMA